MERESTVPFSWLSFRLLLKMSILWWLINLKVFPRQRREQWQSTSVVCRVSHWHLNILFSSLVRSPRGSQLKSIQFLLVCVYILILMPCLMLSILLRPSIARHTTSHQLATSFVMAIRLNWNEDIKCIDKSIIALNCRCLLFLHSRSLSLSLRKQALVVWLVDVVVYQVVNWNSLRLLNKANIQGRKDLTVEIGKKRATNTHDAVDMRKLKSFAFTFSYLSSCFAATFIFMPCSILIVIASYLETPTMSKNVLFSLFNVQTFCRCQYHLVFKSVLCSPITFNSLLLLLASEFIYIELIIGFFLSV